VAVGVGVLATIGLAICLVICIILFARRRAEAKKAIDERFMLELDSDDVPGGIYDDYRY
jgi:hypothetical protein